jgi:hypothetical protein
MKITLYFLAVLIPLLSMGCEKTIHEVRSPISIPSASLTLR